MTAGIASHHENKRVQRTSTSPDSWERNQFGQHFYIKTTLNNAQGLITAKDCHPQSGYHVPIMPLAASDQGPLAPRLAQKQLLQSPAGQQCSRPAPPPGQEERMLQSGVAPSHPKSASHATSGTTFSVPRAMGITRCQTPGMHFHVGGKNTEQHQWNVQRLTSQMSF